MTSNDQTHGADQRPDAATRWIVLILMGADNPPGQTDLTEFATKDIAEMEGALAEEGPERTLEIVYQLHQGGTIRRRHLPASELPGPPELVGAVDGTPLFDFVRWALRETGRGPEDRVMLILWGHSHRFAIGAQLVNGRADGLDFAELVRVLSSLRAPQADGGPPILERFDIIAFDACDASTLEMAYQLHPFARYLLASQIRMPLPGFPYTRVLQRLASPQGRLMGPPEFGRWAVRRFCEFYSVKPDRDTVSLTLLDVQQAPPLVLAVERLARALLLRMNDRTENFQFIKGLFRLSRTIDFADPAGRIKPFVDLADLCLNLVVNCATADVRNAARSLGDLLLSPAPVPGGQSEMGTGLPFIVEHGRNACPPGRLNGVSLYAPHIAGSNTDLTEMNNKYRNFRFARESVWTDLVTAMAEP